MAFVDVGKMGESRTRVTEGGQECVQGMLGNQQVSSCARVCIPPRYKDRLWVTRGQVCTGNQMFFSVQLPVSSKKQPHGFTSPGFRAGSVGLVYTSEVMLMSLKIK